MGSASEAHRPAYDPASLKCAASLPVRMIESSRDIAWTSLLLDHQEVVTADGEFDTSPTTDQTIVVMTSGEQRLEVYDRGRWRRAVYRPDSIGMTPGGTTDRLRRRVSPGAGQARKINLYIPRPVFDEAADHLGRAGRRRATVAPAALAHADGIFRTAALALLRASREEAPDLYAESFAAWAAVHLLTFLRQEDDAIHSGPAVDRRLRRVLELIEHDFASPLTIDRLAAEANVSKFHFVRLFRRATGRTPHRWLIDRRLQAAKRMLETTDLPVAAIAGHCGFARPNHFATAFARGYAMTPGTCRALARGSRLTD